MTLNLNIVKKKILILIIVFLATTLVVFEIITEPSHPKLFDVILEEKKSDNNLMSKIGGFKSYQYRYNKNDLDKDTLEFEIVIIGGTENHVLKLASFRDENGDWQIYEDRKVHVRPKKNRPVEIDTMRISRIADSLYQIDNYRIAADLYEDLIKANDSVGLYHYRRAFSLFQEDFFEEALNEYHKAARLNHRRYDSFFTLALYYYTINLDIDSANKYVNKALIEKPESLEANSLLNDITSELDDSI